MVAYIERETNPIIVPYISTPDKTNIVVIINTAPLKITIVVTILINKVY